MIYCSLDDAFGNDYINETIYIQPNMQQNVQQDVVEPKNRYTCYDFKEHLMGCSHCANILAETRNQFYKQDDSTNNMIIVFLILLLIWAMSSKN